MSVSNGPNAVSIPKNMRMNVPLFFLSIPLNFLMTGCGAGLMIFRLQR